MCVMLDDQANLCQTNYYLYGRREKSKKRKLFEKKKKRKRKKMR